MANTILQRLIENIDSLKLDDQTGYKIFTNSAKHICSDDISVIDAISKSLKEEIATEINKMNIQELANIIQRIKSTY